MNHIPNIIGIIDKGIPNYRPLVCQYKWLQEFI